MTFAIKKFLGTWLMPLPFAVLLLGLGCFSLWRRQNRRGVWLVSIGWVLLLVSSCAAFSDLLLLPLEERFPKWNGQGDNLAFVAVMGASQSEAPRLPLTNRPNTAAVYRLLEGVAIYRANPGSKLVLSGGGEPETSAELMSHVAQSLGVPAQDILLQTVSRDTEQEVPLLAAIVGRKRFAVVTSAVHMPRTMALFEAAGLQPVPAPTHFLNRDNPHPNWRDFAVPSPDNLLRAEFAMHEYLGLWWLRLKSVFI